MLIELLTNFEYVVPGQRPGDPGYYRLYIYLKNEDRLKTLTCEIEVPLANGEEPLVVREARRIKLKNMIIQQLTDELAQYGVKDINSLSTLLDPPAAANQKLPENFSFLEILCCFDNYAQSKHRSELQLIQSGQSRYFEYEVQGDDFIFSVKREFDINLNGRSIESLTTAEKQRLRVKNILIQALISLVASKLRTSENAVRNNYKNLAIKLNRIDYAVLMNLQRQSNPVSETLQTTLQSGNGTLNIEQATNILNHEIYCCLSNATYTDKVWFIQLIRDVFLGVQNLDEICNLYTQIRDNKRKEKVDVHKNPSTDFWLIKENSQSWQQLIFNIRQHAFKLLLKLVDIAEVDADNLFKFGTRINIRNPHEVEIILSEYRNNTIFSEHRGHIVLADMIFDTQTVKNINKLIDECQLNIKDRSRAALASGGL